MDAYKKTMGPCYQYEERICAEKGEDVLAVKKEKERNAWVYIRIIEKRVHQTLKVVSNSTSVLCRKKNGKKCMV